MLYTKPINHKGSDFIAPQTVFKRYELKYRLTATQYTQLQLAMVEHMTLDQYGLHTIDSLYFDTPDYRLIRRSIEKPHYKEKLRLRTYNGSKSGFLELKKKYDGVVYKRRMPLSSTEAMDFLSQRKPLDNQSQIAKELTAFANHYGNLQPMISLRYEREAYFGKANPDFRMTADQNVIMVTQGRYDLLVLPQNEVLLEVKTALGLPTWLLQFFSHHRIYKTSFSKVGTAYGLIQQGKLPQEKPKKGANYVA